MKKLSFLMAIVLLVLFIVSCNTVSDGVWVMGFASREIVVDDVFSDTY